MAVALIDQKRKHSNRAEHVPTDESLLQPKEAQKNASHGVGEGFGDAAADVVDEDVALEVFDLEADLVVAEGDDGPLYQHDNQVDQHVSMIADIFPALNLNLVSDA